jgi:hypothetical protein
VDGVPELKALLQEAKVDEARALVDRLIDSDGGNPEVVAAFEGIYLAEGVRRATRAKEMRRDAIRKLPPKELDYVDPPEVVAAFDEGLACFALVLAKSPQNLKAVILRAGVSHLKTRDREGTARTLGAALAAHPGARDIQMNLRKIGRPCGACGDTGFCRVCYGRGIRRSWLSTSRCETCLGQGVCRRCSIL